MALPSARYEPRRPAEGVLHQIVQAHFETVQTQAASLRDGEGLPRFVEQAGCAAARTWTARRMVAGARWP